VKIQR